MSVDEYLEIERQRGNIITGGGLVIHLSLLSGAERLQFTVLRRLRHRQTLSSLR